MSIDKLDKFRLSCLFVFIINLSFYTHTFLYNLDIYEILVLIFATSIFEYLIFVCPKKNSEITRIISSILYFIFSFPKIFISIYIRQYGNADVFSRAGQAGNLSSLYEYFIAQISLAYIIILVLSIVVSVLLYLNYKNSEYKVNSTSFLYLSSLIFVYFILLLLSYTSSNFEYYNSFASSYISSIQQADNNIYDEQLANKLEKKAEEKNKMPLEYKNLFKNYKHKNKYTGVGKGKNLLIIQVESLQDLFLNKSYNGREICPNLNKLIKKSFYFDDYFESLGLGNSSDAEYVSLHSAYSTIKNGAYQDFKDTDTMGLANICKQKSYITSVMHGNTGEYYNRAVYHPNVGFDNTYYGEYFIQDDFIGMAISDKSFFRQAVPIIEKNKDQKTLTFMITLSSHAPFYLPSEYHEFTTGDDKLLPSFNRYLNAAYYVDKVIGDFLDELEKKGILQNTVVVIYGDHHAFTVSNPEEKTDLSAFMGYDFDYDEMLNIPLIIYVPGYEKAVLCKNTGSQIDFLPTILNIMGWNDTITPMFGVDLLDDELSKNNVVFTQTYMIKGSYITKDYFFEQDRNIASKGRLVNRNTRKEITNSDKDNISKYGEEIIKLSNYIYYNNKINEIRKLFIESQ